ncbi:MAG: type II toxin-antitoxin system RelE/ParE family toxin [Bacillota bacterium]
MGYKLKISHVAHGDIQSIYDYVKKDGVGTAKKQVETIYETLEKVQDNPNIGKKLKNFIDVDNEYFYVIIRKVYIAFYLVDNSEIHVVRILSTRQDYLNILGLTE